MSFSTFQDLWRQTEADAPASVAAPSGTSESFERLWAATEPAPTATPVTPGPRPQPTQGTALAEHDFRPRGPRGERIVSGPIQSDAPAANTPFVRTKPGDAFTEDAFRSAAPMATSPRRNRR